MKEQIETIKKTRSYMLELTNQLTMDQLNEVPAGFNNNIIWNLGHLVAAQQGVCYRRAGKPMIVKEDFFNAYKPDTKPEYYVNEQEVETIRQLFLSTLDQLQTDYQQNVFTNYTPWISRYGVQLNTIEDAISFLLFHEGLHTGYILALKHVIKK